MSDYAGAGIGALARVSAAERGYDMDGFPSRAQPG
jgi:hypothetical protein